MSEASRVLGLSRTTLLAAEEAGLLTALRTPGGHRRYDPAELRRYAERAGAAPSWDDGAAPAPPQAPADAVPLAAAARAALRPLAQALEADSAGLYLLHAGEPRFTAAFGVPRWLAERLSAAPPPAPVAQALGTRRPCLFDPAAAAFPEPRSTGQGVAAALHRDGGALGVLFVVSRRDLLVPEVRVVEAFGDVVAMLVADERRIVELERRLEAIAALTRAP
ncbi:GAF domain-containing protein [Pseudonocardia adelaidensis]|uniref:GAF domain-containing protein n=1 Tax=Pseudonocardia adelaidensis TaxID=648754 RepID=UPI0031F02A77